MILLEGRYNMINSTMILYISDLLRVSPQFIRDLLEISPYLAGALVLTLVIRFAIVPLIHALKGK